MAGGAVATVLGAGLAGTQRVVTGRSVGFPAHFVFVTRLGSMEVTFTDLSPAYLTCWIRLMAFSVLIASDGRHSPMLDPTICHSLQREIVSER